MATKNFTQFNTASPLLTSDYIVGYNAAGTAELKTTVKQIVDLVGETDSQTLSFNEATKDLSISYGNTVSLSAFPSLSAGKLSTDVLPDVIEATIIPRKGTFSQINSEMLIEGEIAVTTDTDEFRIGNGILPGGIGKNSWAFFSNNNFTLSTAPINVFNGTFPIRQNKRYFYDVTLLHNTINSGSIDLEMVLPTNSQASTFSQITNGVYSLYNDTLGSLTYVWGGSRNFDTTFGEDSFTSIRGIFTAQATISATNILLRVTNPSNPNIRLQIQSSSYCFVQECN